MESSPYEKNPGGGVSLQPPPADPLPSSAVLLQISTRSASAIQPQASSLQLSATCQHLDARGHRCKMLTPNPNSTLCFHHTRQLAKQQRRQQTALAKDLLVDAGNFTTADGVNAFLGNLVKQMAHKRINRNDAMAMAYVSQLLLTSVSALRQEMEADYDQAQTTQLLDLFRRRDAQPAQTPKSTNRARAAHLQPSQPDAANFSAPPKSPTGPSGT